MGAVAFLATAGIGVILGADVHVVVAVTLLDKLVQVVELVIVVDAVGVFLAGLVAHAVVCIGHMLARRSVVEVMRWSGSIS